MTHKKRIVYIRNLLKVAAEFETNAGRRVVLACLHEVYRGLDAETLSGCVDISVVSFVVTISNCSQLAEGSDQVVSEAMQTLAVFIKRCEDTGYQRCPSISFAPSWRMRRCCPSRPVSLYCYHALVKLFCR